MFITPTETCTIVSVWKEKEAVNRTPIEWTDFSCNPLKMRLPNGDTVNVCVHKSEGCRNCYAESIVRHFWKKEWQTKYGDFPGYTPALLKLGEPVLVEKELEAVLRLSERIASGKADPSENKIFWNDMTDEYLDFWPDELLDKIWAVRALTPNLIHQVLTKRAERMRDYICNREGWERLTERIFRTVSKYELDETLLEDCIQELRVNPSESEKECWVKIPLPNVHLGVSVEDQQTADERIPWLLKTPAAVRWVSYEPALGPANLRYYLGPEYRSCQQQKTQMLAELARAAAKAQGETYVDWVVCGGESGPGARPFDVQWARHTITQCRAAGVPVFVKQLGAHPACLCNDQVLMDGPTLEAMAFSKAARCFGCGFKTPLKDKKGGDPSEWPEDLRVREYPQSGA